MRHRAHVKNPGDSHTSRPKFPPSIAISHIDAGWNYFKLFCIKEAKFSDTGAVSYLNIGAKLPGELAAVARFGGVNSRSEISRIRSQRRFAKELIHKLSSDPIIPPQLFIIC